MDAFSGGAGAQKARRATSCCFSFPNCLCCFHCSYVSCRHTQKQERLQVTLYFLFIDLMTLQQGFSLTLFMVFVWLSSTSLIDCNSISMALRTGWASEMHLSSV